MAFWIASSPHSHEQSKTSALMRLVIYALIPGIVAQWYFFGWGSMIVFEPKIAFLVRI